MTKNRAKPFKNLIILAAAVILLTVLLLILLPGRNTGPQVDTQKGVQYIKAREALGVTEIEDRLFQRKITDMLAEIDENVQEDPDYVWTALAQLNTVFMGDSRAVSYETYGFVDSSRCLADGAQSIRVIPDHYEELKVANPRLIVLAYGLNDVGWFWTTPEAFAEELMGYVDEIHSFLPDCKIYIQSTLLPREGVDAVFNNPGLYERVREWNTTAKQIYLENGYHYLEVGELVEANTDLFLDDGIHFAPAFYPMLASELLKQYMADMMTNE